MPALVTPFDRYGDIDLQAHETNLRVLADRGIRGFLIAGSTGEGSTFEPGERGTLVELQRRLLGRSSYVMVGVWAESVRLAMGQVDEAAEAGADSVLVVTPTTLARRSVDAQRRYFTAVGSASPIPVLLYSVPPNTGYALDEAAALELAQHPNIVGMKDSGADAARIQRIIASTPDDFMVFNGASASVSLAMASGAFGAITASTNYIPGAMSEIVTATRKSTSKGFSLQPEVTAVTRTVETHGIPGVKAASSAAGLDAGLPRAPFKAVSSTLARRLVATAQRFDR